MIAFVTLFLGLTTGTQVVEVAVSQQVATVELRLDGELVGRLSGAPWKTQVDLGPELMPRELVALARDGAGVEVDRVTQQVNVPRPALETEILLDGWQGGRPRYARLIWASKEPLEPDSIAVSLDGRALEIGDPGRIELPPVHPGSLHFISAELTFSGNRRSTTQAVFGGHYGEKVESELTAVPVLLGRRRLESPAEGSGWLRRSGGETLRVVAVEHDPAELLIVRDEAALPTLHQLDHALGAGRGRDLRRFSPAVEDRLFLVSPRAFVSAHPGVDYELYPISRALAGQEASFPRVLARFGVGKRVTTTEQRLSNAVAVAGVHAAAGGKRRAVLLVVSDCAKPSGHWSGVAVRRYLAELRVPLEVWTSRPPRRRRGGFCRGARHLIGTQSYERALARRRRLLERQQILWVEGSHLPGEIVLAQGAPATEVVELN